MVKRIDLTGKRFGKLLVVSQAESAPDQSARWNCLCDCGNTCIVRGRSLRQNKVTDCGCETVRFYDLTGRRFGHLTAEQKMPPNGDGKTRWLCKCDCGNVCTALSLDLRKGKKTDCGCVTPCRPGNFDVIDLSGQRFGKLTAMEKAPPQKDRRTRWICQCDCGRIYTTTSQALRKGLAKSCGCGRKKELAGQRFGHLTALERSDKFIQRSDGTKRYLWKCICDCGAIVYRLPEKLRSNINSGCDECLEKEHVAAMLAKAGFVDGTQLSKISRTEPNASNTSGVRGVCWNSRTQKWRAALRFQGQNHFLGEYDDIADAIKARHRAEDEYFLPVLEAHKANM